MFAGTIILLTILGQAVDDPVYSGPQVGEKITPFEITVAVGQDAGKKVDLLAKAKNLPLVIVFVHERTRPAFGLSNTVMRFLADRKGKLIGGLVYLHTDPTDALTWMGNVARHIPKGVIAGVSPDGIEGPEAYGLNRKVGVTVLVSKNNKVTANFALIQPSTEADGPGIFKAIAEVLGEKDVPEISAYGRNERTRGKMEEGAIRNLLRPMLDKSASKEKIDVAAKRIEQIAAKRPAVKSDIGNRALKIVGSERFETYGNSHCQEYLKKWAKEFVAVRNKQDGQGDNGIEKPTSKESLQNKKSRTKDASTNRSKS